MIKKARRFSRVVAAITVLVFVLSTVAFAAIPNGTLVVGNKAYDLNYVVNPANENEIRQAITTSGNQIYFKGYDGKWVDLNNQPVSSSVIPAVTYKDKNGNTTQYAAGDTDVSNEFSLKMSALKTQLVADGADNTIVSVAVYKGAELDQNFKGTVRFTSLKGATFAKSLVAFDKGIASVQLTSISSATVIHDTIIAAIADAENQEYIGKTAQISIDYVPASASQEVGEKVFITYAESDRASDVFVQFNKPFDFTKLYQDWIVNGTIKVNGNNPVDIIKIDDRTVKLVLDEDHALTDNSQITVSGISSGVNGALIDGSYTFNLVDAKAPEAVGVTNPDYRTIVAEFTEPVSMTEAEKVANWVLNGHQLTSADVAFIKVGRDVNNDGVIKAIDVVSYDITTHTDNRNFVTIQLTPTGMSYLKEAGKVNLLQAYNIIDYAGLTDVTGQNKATTQEFTFTTPQPPAAPTISDVVMDSPEQFRVKFSTEVQKKDTNGTPLDANDFKFEYQNGVDANNNPVWVTVNLENTPTHVNDTTNGIFAVVTPLSNKEYLIELEVDWTKILNTLATNHNYYTPNYNKVKITALKSNIENLLGVDMAEDQSKTVTMTLDAQSPTIADAKQIIINNIPQQAFYVKMSEPVQMNTGNSAKDTKELTPSQTQEAGTGIPTPTFQFVSEDLTKTIDGELGNPINDSDTEFVVVPKQTLDAGKWTIYIRSISDDVGNTSATVSYVLQVQGVSSPTGEAKIIWADAHDNVDTDATPDGIADYDIVHIQFGTIMSYDALKTNIYTINGKVLPQGTMITSEIQPYMDLNNDGTLDQNDLCGTRVTIWLPKNFLGNISDTPVNTTDYDNSKHTPDILNVSKTLTDENGNAISGLTEVQLTYVLSGYSIKH
ncbi:hypothetical protein [Caldicellulosiruptor sp. DIB 104C]|uniref:hypothetical protein n=1 Tax=Caldicellulosiruptor sp. DIB 104C TaxID=3019889 RepID=UPI0023062292|nr:hypothetical protein [Caldicellulosiruptor sp. DIB 104C]